MANRTVVFCMLLFLGSSLFQTSGGFSLPDFSLPDFSLGDLLKGSWVPEFIRNRRLTGSSTSTACEYPGVVAITMAGKQILYTGVYSSGSVRVPDDSLTMLQSANTFSKLQIQTDKGSGVAEVAAGSLKGKSNGDGTSTFNLTKDFSSYSCSNNDATVYNKDTMSVDVSTCKVVGYGRQIKDFGTFGYVLRTSTLLKNPLQPVCSMILPNLLNKEPKLGHPNVNIKGHHFSCCKSQQGICYGDIGAPIFCTDTTSKSQVVVGMVNTGVCKPDETFVTLDLTGGSLTELFG